jgi:phosphoribosyl 1,2-cyclic phosphodiesterase
VGALDVAGIKFEPLRVEHGIHPDGSPFYALGFRIADSLVYLSGVSAVPGPVMQLLTRHSIDTLILDCLHPNDDFVSHLGWPGAQRLIEQLRPRRTWLVGMGHQIEHGEFNAHLPDMVSCAYDGLELTLTNGKYGEQ